MTLASEPKQWGRLGLGLGGLGLWDLGLGWTWAWPVGQPGARGGCGSKNVQKPLYFTVFALATPHFAAEWRW